MMNALKFLAVDRSLDSGKDFVGRFQMREFGMLPVLTGKRPVATTAQPEAAEERPPGRRSIWRRLFGWVRQTPAAAASSVEQQPELPPCRQTMPEPPESGAGPSQAKGEGGGRFAMLAGCNPFGRNDKKDVQAEFRFEHVRVVCNELHDTDFIIKT